jgi:hypothetical protein
MPSARPVISSGATPESRNRFRSPGFAVRRDGGRGLLLSPATAVPALTYRMVMTEVGDTATAPAGTRRPARRLRRRPDAAGRAPGLLGLFPGRVAGQILYSRGHL